MTELAAVFEKDLKKLKEEILQYDSEDLLFKTVKGISNSGGNLSMHLCGNLRHFIGAVLGNSGYVRNREEEFTGRFTTQKLVEDIEETIAIVKSMLSNLSEDDFSKTYPLQVFGSEMSTQFFIYHLLGHLNYHLGQINYHRRLITN
ncbi:DinB family protein [Jiulongibacter sediminis]|uniref:DinB superfamily protein n=1 Tax=Jiulongibacter sediminis TaxID=1605367 RepID=A0A0P7C2N1_9BACT|nr:DUF1572 family protein [Jiulongibacter sediminis]KPM48350.1 DinB superfamily protein [Jiulongibacter sediminis]TBX24887.1 DinB superfamily protein [Jiulongibacter sediminis]